jgi:CheY-like chemotaxis protein
MAKILIVDDEPVCRESTRLLLSFQGFDVRTAAGSSDAYQVALGFVPDVLIVDWILRDALDGLEIAETLRTTVNRELRTILLTGYLSAALEDRAKAFPSLQYLTKPIEPADLLSAVAKAAASGRATSPLPPGEG